MNSKKINFNYIILKIKKLSLIDFLIFSSLIIAFFFSFFAMYFHTTLHMSNGNTVYYFQSNTYFSYGSSGLQILFSLNPFATTFTIFIAFAILLSIFKWLNNLLNSIYLIKLYGLRIIFDNPLLNQILIYFLLFYIPMWNTICPNPYLLDTHFNFYTSSPLITNNLKLTAGGILFAIFYFLSSLYIFYIVWNQASSQERLEIIHYNNVKKVVIFGITGSIGLQAIEVIKESLKYKVEIVGCSFYKNEDKISQILKNNDIKYVYSPLSKNFTNSNSYEDLLLKSNPDLVINAISGFAGVEISFLALKNKKTLLLANKESLVCAGSLLIKLSKENNTSIIPIDSEHTSLKSLIDTYGFDNIKELLITCSGGPFFNKTDEELDNVTFEDAIKHPNWNMGNKISVDSATLMNKTFEIIEAFWLFDTTRIKPVFHNKSIVHAMIELKNNAFIMYTSQPSMLLPIQLALNNRCDVEPVIDSIDFNNLDLMFGEIDKEKWTSLKLADLYLDRYSHTTFGTIITVLDEIAIWKFKNDQIAFKDINKFIHNNYSIFNIEKLESYIQIEELKNKIYKEFNYND